MIESVGLIMHVCSLLYKIVISCALMIEFVMDVNYIELHVGYMLKLVNNILELVRINLVLNYCVVVELSPQVILTKSVLGDSGKETAGRDSTGIIMNIYYF